jgi:hypothetical protein
MIVQAVCLPEGSKTLVIPIFLPIIPFIVYCLCLQDYWDSIGLAYTSYWPVMAKGFNPRLLPTFSFCSEVPAVNKP